MGIKRLIVIVAQRIVEGIFLVPELISSFPEIYLKLRDILYKF